MTHEQWMTRQQVLSMERTQAAYSIVGGLRAELQNHKRTNEPIDPIYLQEAMDRYDAADRALEEFYKQTDGGLNLGPEPSDGYETYQQIKKTAEPIHVNGERQ